jgi:hypothetical protein
MLYRIHLGDQSTTRRRSDAAMLAAERMAYDRIADHGGLDTQQGHDAMARVCGLDPARGGTVEVYGAILYLTPSISGN